MDEVLRGRGVCRASEQVPHLPIAGNSLASSFNEQLQVDMLFLYDAIALRAMDVYSKCPHLVLVRSKSLLEVWDVSCVSRIAVFG